MTPQEYEKLLADYEAAKREEAQDLSFLRILSVSNPRAAASYMKVPTPTSALREGAAFREDLLKTRAGETRAELEESLADPNAPIGEPLRASLRERYGLDIPATASPAQIKQIFPFVQLEHKTKEREAGEGFKEAERKAGEKFKTSERKAGEEFKETAEFPAAQRRAETQAGASIQAGREANARALAVAGLRQQASARAEQRFDRYVRAAGKAIPQDAKNVYTSITKLKASAEKLGTGNLGIGYQRALLPDFAASEEAQEFRAELAALVSMALFSKSGKAITKPEHKYLIEAIRLNPDNPLLSEKQILDAARLIERGVAGEIERGMAGIPDNIKSAVLRDMRIPWSWVYQDRPEPTPINIETLPGEGGGASGPVNIATPEGIESLSATATGTAPRVVRRPLAPPTSEAAPQKTPETPAIPDVVEVTSRRIGRRIKVPRQIAEQMIREGRADP